MHNHEPVVRNPAVAESAGLSVLVVAHDARRIQHLLAGEELIGRVKTVTDALGALCAISTMPNLPHVLVLDADVPHLDAADFLRVLMEVCAIPVVLCACAIKHGPEVIHRARQAGAAIAEHGSAMQSPGHLADAIRQAARIDRSAMLSRVRGVLFFPDLLQKP